MILDFIFYIAFLIFQGVGPIVSYDGASSSSTAAWEQGKLHGFGQGVQVLTIIRCYTFFGVH